MTKPKGNQKHLTISDRIIIEKGLTNGDSFAEIARNVQNTLQRYQKKSGGTPK